MANRSKSVVLLHGWPGTSADYRRVRELLPKDVSVHTPDLMGYGEGFNGTVSLGQASAKSHADRIIKLIVDNNLVRPVIGGYDIGSRIAQAIAVQAPELIKGLVVTPGYAGMGDRASSPELQHLFWYQHFHRLELAGDILDGNRAAIASYINHFIKSWSYTTDIINGDRFEQLVGYYARPNAFRASVVWYEANKGYSGTDPIDVPTTMLWPKQDPLFPIEWADRLSEFFSNASLEPVQDCGHFVPLESPSIFAKNLLNHLNVL